MAASEQVVIGPKGYWDGQLEAFEAIESGKYDVVVFRTGYGGGKTILGSDWLHTVAVEVPKSDNLAIAPDYAKGGPGTFKTVFDRLPGEHTIPDEGGDPENSPIIKKYHAVDRRLTYVNGSIVRLGSADKWNRYAGSEFNAIWCDEPAHYDNTDLYDLTEMLTSRQRTERGPNVMLWTSTGSGFNEYYDITERQIAYDENGEEMELPWKDSLKVIVRSSLDNPWLEEKEKLIRQFEGTERAKQALYGGFAAPTGLVYGDFSRERHVIPETEAYALVSGDWRMYGYDHGWGDPRVVLEIAKTSYGQYLVVDSFYRSETEYQKAVEWLVENDKPEGTVYAEHEPEHQEAFKRAGYDCEPAIKDLDEGIPAVRDYVDWRDDPEDRPGLLVSDRCVDLIKEFQSYKEEDVGSKRAVDHALDALRYAIMGDTYTEDRTGWLRDWAEEQE